MTERLWSKEGSSFEKLAHFCYNMGVGFTIDFSEPENRFEVTFKSPAPSECFYIKKCHDLEYALDLYKTHLSKEGINAC